MLSSATQKTGTSNISSVDADAKKFGIERIDVPYFLYRRFRYTDLKDAIAQAKRDEALRKGEGS
ncbi:MAG: hypothetical protein RIB03_07350 [Henriciella sp.]|uniref:hypothetical protein n=1 Tax=Henriciella sp. TaxID=1968823 RepID=UPI0032EDF2EC